MTATSVRDTGDLPNDEPPHALIERRGHVLIVTMNRRPARNALSPVHDGAHAPGLGPGRQPIPDVRVCVLTGAGGAFCAGADLKAMTSDAPGRRGSGPGTWTCR